MFRYIALFVIPALVWSTCCPPTKWEGTEYVAIGSTDKDGSGHYTEIEQNVTVDMDMRRIFISQSLMADGYPVQQTILQDFGSGEQYVRKMVNGREVCERQPLDSMEPGCIPQNSTKIISSYFGAGSSKLAATMYRYNAGMSTVYATVSDDGCIPLVYESTGSTADGGGYSMTIEFYRITPGVSDYHVFSTPRNCHIKTPIFTGVGK